MKPALQPSLAAESGDFCRKDYIYWPLSSNKRLMIDRVMGQVTGPDVLDIGCGEAGLYWALTYASKIKSMSFYDLDKDATDTLLRQLDEISPDYLERHFSDTVNYAKAQNVLAANISFDDLAISLIEKTHSVRPFNFRQDKSDERFDTILSLESLQVADTQEELSNQVANTASMLKSGGKILGIGWCYDRLDAETEMLIRLKSFGRLNPSARQYETAFAAAGLTVTQMETIVTTEIHNFSRAVIFSAEKK